MIDEYIIVEDENGDMDFEKTADQVCKDMIINGMIICMRDRFAEMCKDDNTNWIDDILNKGDDDA